MSSLQPQQLHELGVVGFYRKLYEAALAEVQRNIDPASQPTTKTLPNVHPSVALTQTPQAVSPSEVIASLSTARVVLISQYQTLPECRFSVATLIQQLQQQGPQRPLACALDNFSANAQPLLQALKSQHLDLGGFEQANQTLMQYGVRFWQSLQPLLGLQIKSPLQLLAADADSDVVDLEKRDRQTIKVVESWLKENPHGTCFVLLGERRLMEGRVYEALQKYLGDESQVVVLLQAWEEAYWRLLDSKAENAIVGTDYRPFHKWGQQLYSFNMIPPIVKLDSYLTWSEQQEFWPGWPCETAVQEMRLLISRTLKLPESTLPPIQLYCCGDLTLLERIRKLDGLTADEGAALLTQIIRRESFYLPRLNLIYLATLDSYHMGEEIGHSLRLHLSGEQTDKMVWTSRGWLYYSAINEAAGYLASKIVTPGRKPGKKSQKFCQQLATTQNLSKIDSASKEQLMVIGHQAGYGLGEMIYRQMQVGGPPMQPLFTKAIGSEEEAQHFFQQLYKEAAVEAPPRRMKIKKKDTIHKRLHYVGLFYFLLFFLPALFWGQSRQLFHFPNPLSLNLGRDLSVAIGTTILVVMLSFILGRFVRPFRELSLELKRVLGPLTIDQAFLLAAFSGIGEELLFRGVLQAEVGLVFSSLLFSVLHFVPDRRFVVWPFFAFVVGLLLGLSYQFTGNLIVPIIGHVLINFCNILLMMKNRFWLKAS